MKYKKRYFISFIIIFIIFIIFLYIFQSNKIYYKQPKTLKEFELPKIESIIGSIEIESINLKSDVIYGDNQSFIDKYDICLSNKFNLFGENNVILLGGHNTKKLKKLKNVSINDKINIKTDYGNFNYIVTEIYITKVNDNKNELIDIKKKKNVLELESNKEILQIYTCYGSTNPNTPYRLLIKAEKITKESEKPLDLAMVR